MANAIDISLVTVNAKEVEGLGQVVVEKIFDQPALTQCANVMTGVKMKQQMLFATKLSKTGVAGTGCTRVTSGAESSFREVYLEPAKVEDTLIMCQAEVDSKFKPWWNKVTKFNEFFNLEESGLSDANKFVTLLLTQSAQEAALRLAWLGDKTVAQAGAAVAGVNAAATVKFYSGVYGLWYRIFAAVTAGDLVKVDIDENAEDTTALQLTLADGRAVQIFESIWAASDPRLKANPNAKFMVSNAIFENYRKYLQGKGENFSIDYTIEGFRQLKWNGKTIINMETVWDLLNQADFVKNTATNAYFYPNRVIFADPAELIVASLESTDMPTLESFYYQKDRTNYSSYGFTLDTQLGQLFNIQVAY
jgi:hypothetical protein